MFSEGSLSPVVGGLDARCGDEGEPVVDAVPYLRSEPPDLMRRFRVARAGLPMPKIDLYEVEDIYECRDAINRWPIFASPISY